MKLLRHIALLLYIIGSGLIVKHFAYNNSVSYEFCEKIADGNFCWYINLFVPLCLIAAVVFTIFCINYLLQGENKAIKVLFFLLYLTVFYYSAHLGGNQGKEEFLTNLKYIDPETINWEASICEEGKIRELKLKDTCYMNVFSNAHYSEFNECKNIPYKYLDKCAKMVIIYSKSSTICEEVSKYINKETCENMRNSVQQKILFCFEKRLSTEFWDKGYYWPSPKYVTDCLRMINNSYGIEGIDNLAVAISCLFPENKTEVEISNCLKSRSKLKYTITGQSQDYSVESHTTTIHPDVELWISNISINNRFRMIQRSPFILEKNWE